MDTLQTEDADSNRLQAEISLFDKVTATAPKSITIAKFLEQISRATATLRRKWVEATRTERETFSKLIASMGK